MVITHRFNNERDLEEGGMWFGDDGELICKWNWDRKFRKLDVRCGSWGSPNLPSCISISNSDTHVERSPALYVMASPVDLIS